MVNLRPRPPKDDIANAQRQRNIPSRVLKSPKTRTSKTARVNNTMDRAQEEDIGDNIVVAPRKRTMDPMPQPALPVRAAAGGEAEEQAQEDSDIGDNIVVARRIRVGVLGVARVPAEVLRVLRAAEHSQNAAGANEMADDANMVDIASEEDAQMQDHAIPDVAAGEDAGEEHVTQDEMELASEQDAHTVEVNAAEETAVEPAVGGEAADEEAFGQDEMDLAEDTVDQGQQATHAAGAAAPTNIDNGGAVAGPSTGSRGQDPRDGSTNWHIIAASAMFPTPPPPAVVDFRGPPTPPPARPPLEPRECSCCNEPFGTVSVDEHGHYRVDPALAEWHCKKCHFMVHKECQQDWLLHRMQANSVGTCLNWYVSAFFLTRLRASC